MTTLAVIAACRAMSARCRGERGLAVGVTPGVERRSRPAVQTQARNKCARDEQEQADSA